MSSDDVNKATRQEWRELGFFYNRDDDTKTWQIVGSRTGLLRFRDALRAYARDPRNAQDSEHAHYGPYMYLKIMTWPQPRLDRDGIGGPLSALARLADVVDAKIATARSGATIDIGSEFAANGPYALRLEVQEDEFDPAGADPALYN
jgi:hypothetical protein